MAAIPTWLWLVSGIAIMFFSKYSGGKIEMFFWVGLLFALIGFAKLLIGYIMRKSETIAEKSEVGKAFSEPMKEQVTKFCPRCNGTLRAHDFFCSRCGTRVR